MEGRIADDRDSDSTTEVTSEDEAMPAAQSLDSSTHNFQIFLSRRLTRLQAKFCYFSQVHARIVGT